MFDRYPTYSRYRTLTSASPVMKGEDVFALQTALNACHIPCGPEDGILGVRTANAIRIAQVAFDLNADGKAGGLTQRVLAIQIAKDICATRKIPLDVLRGQMEHESGFRLGNYSPIRTDGSYDAGVCQRNTQHTPAQDGFHVLDSITQLAKMVQSHFELFVGIGTVSRRWQLAQGAWNAPAFACYIAREEGATKVAKSMTLQPTDEQHATFEAYMRHVSIYYT